MGIEQSIDTLVAAFNRGSLDVPDNVFTPQTTFILNERSYEAILGGSSDDPLIRLLARGVGGYRTAARALQYALQHPIIRVESLSDADGGVLVAECRIEGNLRDSNERFVGRCSLRLTSKGAELTEVKVNCSDEDLARITSARS